MNWNGRFRLLAMVVTAFVGAATCTAQFHLLAGKLDSNGLPTTPARICPGASGTEHCYSPPSDKYAFGLDPKNLSKNW